MRAATPPARPGSFAWLRAIAWENRDQLPFAWRILRHGVCDGCTLGASGFDDWTFDGVHLCPSRLEGLRRSTMPELSEQQMEVLLDRADRLEHLTDAELQRLGRLGRPLVRRNGDDGFRVLSWKSALDLVAQRLRDADPDRLAWSLSSSGLDNETYYVAQKVARRLGCPHVDHGARERYAAGAEAMRRALGTKAATGSFRDWIDADLIVLVGANLAEKEPMAIRYLHLAKESGAEIAAVNPLREPALERYRMPTLLRSRSATFPLCDHWYEVDVGGDLAFFNGVLKSLLATPGGIDEAFVAGSCAGWGDVREELEAQSWAVLEAESGTSRDQMERFARLLVSRPDTVLVWSSAPTRHEHGAETVQALCNLALARGLFGRPRRGLLPLGGPAGAQGATDLGCLPAVEPEVLAQWGAVWGFDPPVRQGCSTREQLAAAASGDLDVLWLVGADAVDEQPGLLESAEALGRVGLRVHQDLTLRAAMLVEPADTVLLLPAASRYESQGGVTLTTAERRIVFSPEIPGRRIGQARPAWLVLAEAAARAAPACASSLFFEDAAAIRAEVARAVPEYHGVDSLTKRGHQMQWGGATLYSEGRFPTPSGRACFHAVPAPRRRRACSDALLWLSVRSRPRADVAAAEEHGGGHHPEILLSEADLARLRVGDGDSVLVQSALGSVRCRTRVAAIKSGNAEIGWQAGQTLVTRRRDEEAWLPHEGAAVAIEPWGEGIDRRLVRSAG